MTAERQARQASLAYRSLLVRAAAFLVGALLFFAASAHAQAVPAPDTVRIAGASAVIYVVDLTPPPEYARWYRAAEVCIAHLAGGRQLLNWQETILRPGNYKRVRWYLTAKPWTDHRHPGVTLAAWRPGHRITMSRHYAADSAVVMHEAIHDILAYNGLNDDRTPHPMPWYDGRCAQVAYP